jgi:hypothetical protein
MNIPRHRIKWVKPICEEKKKRKGTAQKIHIENHYELHLHPNVWVSKPLHLPESSPDIVDVIEIEDVKEDNENGK